MKIGGTEAEPFECFYGLDAPEVEAWNERERFTPAELIEDALLSAGVPAAAIPAAVAELEALLDAIGIRRAGQAFVTMVSFGGLSKTPSGVALQRILLGDDETVSLRDEAKRLGCSHVAIVQAEKRLRKALQLPEGSLKSGWID